MTQTPMSSPHSFTPIPRVVIASFDDYAGAQRAVDYLSDQRFPVERIAIVGEGLKLVEQVTGRLTWGRALGSGLLSGAVIGLLIGLLFGLFALSSAALLSLLLYGLVMGAVFGALWALIGYALTGGRRDFTSVGGMRADRYNVLTDPEVAEEAHRLLARLPAR